MTLLNKVAEQTNQDLLVLVNETAKDFELNPLLLTLIRELTSHHIPTRMAALSWINMLLEKAPQVKSLLDIFYFSRNSRVPHHLGFFLV